MNRPILISLGILGLASATLADSIPAFPEALGFGAYATGGRTGSVYHVTNLNDNGSGSFRDAVSSSNRIVVFDVGGYIQLDSAVLIANNTTIAGQTAPGEGIGFRAGELSCANHSNIIMRYLRIRPGSETSSTTDDALSLYRASNVMIDHCSFEFAPWNNIDGVGTTSYPVTNISFQYCLIANPIYQQFGAHCESVGGNWSWYYNAFVNSHNRNPLAKTNTVFVNNILYNYQAGYTTHTSTSFKHDIVNNYFIIGPSLSTDNTWYQVDKNQSIYYSGNLKDSDEDGSLDGSTTTPYWYQGTGTVLSSPWSTVTSSNPIYSATAAFRLVTSWSGTLPYDQMDSIVWGQVNTLGSGSSGTTAGTTGSLYSSQTSTGLDSNGYGVITGATKATDTDNDGMPDYWEAAMGSDSATDDAMTLDDDGYALVEEYINWLGTMHASVLKNSYADIDLRSFTQGFQSVSPSYTLSDASNGTTALLSDGYTVRFTPTANFTGLGSCSFTVTGTDGSSYTGTVSVLVKCSDIVSGPTLTYVGPGSINQIVLLGDTITRIAYTYAACTGASATGLPSGVSATLNTSDSTITLSGTPATTGSYTFTITTSGGDGDAALATGTINVIAKADTASVPASIESYVNAAYPSEGLGAYEEKNEGWIDSGYYNFTNSLESYALWNLKATTAKDSAVLVIRYANGGTTERYMTLNFNNDTLGAAPFTQTGAWTSYDSVCLYVNLVQGLNTIQLNSIDSNGGPNIDEFEFDIAGVTLWTDSSSEGNEEDSTLDSTTQALLRLQDQAGYSLSFIPGLQGNQIQYQAAHSGAQLVIYDLQGKAIVQKSLPQAAGTINVRAWGNLRAGNYIFALRYAGSVRATVLTYKAK